MQKETVELEEQIEKSTKDVEEKVVQSADFGQTISELQTEIENLESKKTDAVIFDFFLFFLKVG